MLFALISALVGSIYWNMVEKVAAPFWLCLSAGVPVGLATGNLGLWLIIGGVAGLALGFALRAWELRRKRRAF